MRTSFSSEDFDVDVCGTDSCRIRRNIQLQHEDISSYEKTVGGATGANQAREMIRLWLCQWPTNWQQCCSYRISGKEL